MDSSDKNLIFTNLKLTGGVPPQIVQYMKNELGIKLVILDFIQIDIKKRTHNNRAIISLILHNYSATKQIMDNFLPISPNILTFEETIKTSILWIKFQTTSSP